MGIRAAQELKGWDESSKMRPRNGLGPQKGLAVFDGFQCGLCDELPERRVEDVVHHLYVGHGQKECHIWDAVRIQSWGGKGKVSDEFWIVDERKDGGEKAPGDEKGWSDGGVERRVRTVRVLTICSSGLEKTPRCGGRWIGEME